MNNWQILGYIAAAIGSVSLIPEVIKALRTHHLQDVAWSMLFMFACCSILWGLYGLNNNDIPLMISAAINLANEITLIALKIHYENWKMPLIPHKHLKKTAMETIMNKCDDEKKIYIQAYQIPQTVENTEEA